MLSSYVLGNLVGRLIMSYSLVWLACFAIERFDWRRAFARSRRWPAVVAVLVLFVLGIAGSVAVTGGPR